MIGKLWDFSELYEFAEELKNKKKFEKYAKKAIREVAKELTDVIKEYTPIGETGKLLKGWDKRKIMVIPSRKGYTVLLVNDVPYAEWVNYGHRVKNRKDGPYYKVHNRVEVQSPHTEYQSESDWFVYGHFFVERGIAEYEQDGNLEQIIMENLEKWWDELDG